MDRTSTQHLPSRRKNGIVAEEVSDELLIYDLDTHKAHCLNSTSSLVWKECDGKRSIPEIAMVIEKTLNVSVNSEIVQLALDQLQKRNLLESYVSQLPSPTISRRALIRKLGLATAVALPLVTSLLAPTPAQAATCKVAGQGCMTGVECCSGVCNGGTCQ